MKKINFLLLPLLLGVTSCKKEITLDNPSSPGTPKTISFDEKNISLVNNRLVFLDQDAFDRYINWAKENQSSPEKIKNVIAQKGLKSMMDIYETGMSLNKETEEFSNFCKIHPTVFYPLEFENSLIYELQAPSILAYIANENGIYQVGKKIYRITTSYSYTINDGDESKIPMLFLPVENITNPEIQVTSNGMTSSVSGEYSYKTAYFDSKHRIVVRLRDFIAGSYYYYESRTTAQNQGWTGVWTQENISRLDQSWGPGSYYTIYSDITYPPTNVPYATQTNYNNSDLSCAVVYTIYPVNFGNSSCIAYHSGVRNGVWAGVGNNEIWP